MKEVLPKPAIHDSLLNSFEKAIAKAFGQVKVVDVDNFIEKFKKKEKESSSPEKQVKEKDGEKNKQEITKNKFRLSTTEISIWFEICRVQSWSTQNLVKKSNF